MNKIFQLIWSKSKNCYIVVSELAGSCGKSLSTGAALMITVSALCLLSSAAQADFTVDGTPVAGDTYTNNSGVTVENVITTTPSTSLTNSGTITGYNALTVNSDASLDTITNNDGGLINGDQTALAFHTGFNGVLNNAGTIRADNDSDVYGININGDLTGAINNTGSIIAAYTDSSSVYAYGLYVAGDVTATASVTNNGTITATAISDSSGYYATAYGLYINGDVAGSIINTNTGTINATAHCIGSDAYAYGIYVSNNLTGTGSITNNGNINIEANAPNSDVYAATGIYVSGDVAATANISNTGSIKVDLLAADDYPSGAGIYVSGDMQGTLSNSGEIDMTANVNGYGTSPFYGIYVNTLSGTLTNTDTGTISVNQTVGSSDSTSHSGIYIGTLTGTLNNNGTISVEATGTSYTAYPVGLWINNVDSSGIINNTGTIEAVGNSNAEPYAVYSSSFDGTLNNSGIITATANPGYNAYALYLSGSGTFNNLAGGLIDGELYIGDPIAINNAGTIAIPAGTSTIEGDYTQEAPGTFRTSVEDDITYGQLIVGGTATMPSDAKIGVNVLGSPTLTLNAELTDILSAATLTSDGSFAVSDNSSLFDFEATLDGNTIDLTIIEGTTLVDSVAAVTAESNDPALAAATVLDGVIDDPELGSSAAWAPVITALGQLPTSAEVSDAVSQTLPLLTAGANGAMRNSQNGVNRIVQSRQESNRRGLSSGDTFYGDKQVWAKPFGSWADQDDRKGVSGFESDTYGVIFGIDGEVSSNDRIGAAFAYSRSDVDSNSSVAPSSAEIDSFQLAGYGSHALSALSEINYQADVALHNTEGKRRILFMNQTADSDYESISAHIGVGINRSFSLSDKTVLTPALKADYSWLRSESYTESGAGALNLKVDSNTTDEFIVALEGTVDHHFTNDFMLTANVGVGYDLINDENSITSAFAGASSSSFVTKGLDPSPWLVRGGLGAVMQINETLELNARYDVDIREDFDNQTVSAKVVWAF